MSKVVADVEALSAYADFINTQLYAVGLIDEKLEFGSSELVNAVYSVLKIRLKEQQEYQEVVEKLNHREKDIQVLQREKKVLQGKLEARERTMDGLKMNLGVSKSEVSNFKDAAGKDKDEMTRLVFGLQQRDAQFNHDKRRLERELARTQARLRKMISAKGENFASCIEIYKGKWRKNEEIGTLSLSQVDLGGEVTFSEPTQLSDVVLASYEDEKEQLMEENLQLRNSLEKLQTELGDILNDGIELAKKSKGSNAAASDSGSVGDEVLGNIELDELPTGLFQLPFNIAKPRIEEHILKSMQTLRRARAKLRIYIQEREKEGDIMKLNESLKAEISQYERIIEEKEKLLKLALDLQVSVKKESIVVGIDGAAAPDDSNKESGESGVEDPEEDFQQYIIQS